ncbi:LysR family transcriptional regulator [Rhizobium sp. NRK18]|uniref:LysR family transcriptional regulator n=1 Tax=Rhizobium sp. NRK18 TaxID=2964667 RepID=UPI0021C36E0D|nr:LysR family transcriptional regulator [Rhizobium sp. NRK18]MCQ2003472.1 LysR family transcriptional regulator [Rhizobium sp. NRK18]
MPVSPPRPKGPPLNALRAFEAAARLESFAEAAEELSVTPGAVSQHIRTLEDWTGADLFIRHAQGVRLTAVGKSLLPKFVAAFDHLGEAVRALQGIRPVTDIHIATMPSIAQLWLSPRLSGIRRHLTGIRLSVTALENAPNLKRELFDLSLFIRKPMGLPSETVLEEDLIFPVCAPSLAAQIARPEDLETVPLLFDRSWEEDWDLWLASAGLSFPGGPQGPRYSLYSLALEEAKAGAGVLMGHHALVAPAVASGQLTRLFDRSHLTGKALVLEALPEKTASPEAMTIVRLLRELGTA